MADSITGLSYTGTGGGGPTSPGGFGIGDQGIDVGALWDALQEWDGRFNPFSKGVAVPFSTLTPTQQQAAAQALRTSNAGTLATGNVMFTPQQQAILAQLAGGGAKQLVGVPLNNGTGNTIYGAPPSIPSPVTWATAAPPATSSPAIATPPAPAAPIPAPAPYVPPATVKRTSLGIYVPPAAALPPSVTALDSTGMSGYITPPGATPEPTLQQTTQAAADAGGAAGPHTEDYLIDPSDLTVEDPGNTVLQERDNVAGVNPTAPSSDGPLGPAKFELPSVNTGDVPLPRGPFDDIEDSNMASFEDEVSGINPDYTGDGVTIGDVKDFLNDGRDILETLGVTPPRTQTTTATNSGTNPLLIIGGLVVLYLLLRDK